jgi:Tol biopolymer transport system component
VALVLIALLAAALAIIAGSRPTRIPPPFGPVNNGLIVYPTKGDIYALDPVTGISTALVTGISGDLDALYSPDGTRVAFHRLSEGRTPVTLNIMVADAHGDHAIAITKTQLLADGERFAWAPDSRSLYVQTADRKIWLYDATRAADPRLLATNAQLLAQSAQPPDGKHLLLRRTSDLRDELIVVDVDTGDERLIVGAPSNDLRAASWSTDGQRIAYSGPEVDPASLRLWIVNADGTNRHQVTNAPGTWADIEMAWSPDDRFIAFTRYQRTATDPEDIWEVRPIGLLDVAKGTVVGVGPTSHEVRQQHPTSFDTDASPGEGWAFDWSPDGTTLLAVPSEASGHPVVIDPFKRTAKVLDTIFDEQGGASQEWQRTAP